MEEKTNYGKIIAITLAVITSATAIAFVLYRLFRNLITFCNTYVNPDEAYDELDLDELEELMDEDEIPEEEIVVEAEQTEEA